ncbi:MAG: DUF6064 family protein [Polaromonas sp.]|nr:DUF6064 family protein [Polaromonas sp.]
MSDWWTYRLGDFLMFSPATYARLVEQYQRDVWPAQLIGLAAGLASLWLARSRHAHALRLQALLLASAFLWVAWAFHWQRYASINWAATYLAFAFAVQATLLLSLVLAGRSETPAERKWTLLTGCVLALAGVVAFPLAGMLMGRSWSQIEVFGVSPEPTALAGIGLLLARPGWFGRSWHGALLVVPVLSLVIGAATLLELADS